MSGSLSIAISYGFSKPLLIMMRYHSTLRRWFMSVICQGGDPLSNSKERDGTCLAEAAAEELHARVEVPSSPCYYIHTSWHCNGILEAIAAGILRCDAF